jgi:hypothetical protein
MLEQQASAERERFAAAMQSMDYERALAAQTLLDRLERELFKASARLSRKAERPNARRTVGGTADNAPGNPDTSCGSRRGRS